MKRNKSQPLRVQRDSMKSVLSHAVLSCHTSAVGESLSRVVLQYCPNVSLGELVQDIRHSSPASLVKVQLPCRPKQPRPCPTSCPQKPAQQHPTACLMLLQKPLNFLAACICWFFLVQALWYCLEGGWSAEMLDRPWHAGTPSCKNVLQISYLPGQLFVASVLAMLSGVP